MFETINAALACYSEGRYTVKLGIIHYVGKGAWTSRSRFSLVAKLGEFLFNHPRAVRLISPDSAPKDSPPLMVLSTWRSRSRTPSAVTLSTSLVAAAYCELRGFPNFVGADLPCAMIVSGRPVASRSSVFLVL